jgi:hypothetical protein
MVERFESAAPHPSDYDWYALIAHAANSKKSESAATPQFRAFPESATRFVRNRNRGGHYR